MPRRTRRSTLRLHLILAATSAFAVLLAQAPRADAGPVPTHIADAATFFSLATFYEEDMFFTSGHPLPDPYSQGRATLSTGGHNTIILPAPRRSCRSATCSPAASADRSTA